MELLSLSEENLIILLQVMNNSDEINYFFKNNYQNKIRDLREAHIKSLNGMEELKRFQELRIDEFSKGRLIEDQDTILELTARFRNYRMKLIVRMTRVLKDAESVRSGHSHIPSQPTLLPPFRDPGGMPSRSLGMPSRNDRPPDTWDTHGISGNVFANPTASSSAPVPRESNPWISVTSEHTSPQVMSESQTPNTTLDPRSNN